MSESHLDRADLFVAAGGLGSSASGRVRLRTLIMVRWLAVIGQTFSVLFVQFGIGFELPLIPCLLTIAASAALNIILSINFPGVTQLSNRGAALFLSYDLLQLSALLYMTGGLVNPFSILILVPVTISATVLSPRSTIALAALALGFVGLLAFWHLPLPWQDTDFSVPTLYRVAIWAGLSLGIVFMSLYAGRVALETRRMSAALSATHSALAREQQLSAVGGLAASAAHELGTPLGTIHLVARELSRDASITDEHREDMELLVSQADRCRDILRELSRRPGEGDIAFRKTTLVGLIEAAIEPYLAYGKPIHIQAQTGLPPTVYRSPEVLHGLANFIENAVDYSATEVWVRAYWDAPTVDIVIEDDGPGIPLDVLRTMGEPYRSTRTDGEGMGLGVFISKTLLEHSGARVQFSNRFDNNRIGGARISIHWPEGIIDPSEAIESGRNNGLNA